MLKSEAQRLLSGCLMGLIFLFGMSKTVQKVDCNDGGVTQDFT